MNSFSLKAREHIRNSSHWNAKSKESNGHFYGLKCPSCGEPEAYWYSEKPFSIHCHRLNKCGAKTRLKDLFPEIFQFEKCFPATKEDPHFPAKAYLQSRGITKEAIDGIRFEYRQNIRGGNSGGIMFFVGTNEKNMAVFNGRVFNPSAGEGKTHNDGACSGMLWRPVNIDTSKEVYFTESIFDALSLIQMGCQAVSVLTASVNPENFDISEFQKPIIAFNSDPAGIKGLKKWKKYFPRAQAILPPNGFDWNDLLCSNTLDAVKKRFGEEYGAYETQAKLALAETAERYASIYYEFFHFSPGLFEFEKQYYHATVKKQKEGNIIETRNCSNFLASVEYFSLNSEIPDKPEYKYYLKVTLKTGKTSAFECDACELSTPGALRTLFLSRAAALWSGDQNASISLIKKIVESKAPSVRQLHKVGYDLQSGCYVFSNFCILPSGEYIQPDAQGFYKISADEYLRPVKGNSDKIRPEKEFDPSEIFLTMQAAWPQRAEVAITWVFASWFVNQVKDRIGYFPFLSLHGDSQTGKTALCKKLNHLQGLDEEGLPINEVNTKKGLTRKLAQRSGLFIALIESKGVNQNRTFDVNIILPLYNINPLQTRAQTTNDLKTHDTPFLSAIAFIQNREPFVTQPQKERVVSLLFTKDQLDSTTAAALDRLLDIPPSAYTYFFKAVMKHRQHIENTWYEHYNQAKKDLKESIPDARIRENHALILAFYRIIVRIINIGSEEDLALLETEFKTYLEKIGREKIITANMHRENSADSFLDFVLNMDNEIEKKMYMDITPRDHRLYLHLNGALTAIRERGPQFNTNLDVLYENLRQHPSFIESGKTHRFKGLERKGHSSWVFDMNKIVTS